LPTGRSIEFTPNGDIAIRDGEAAIEMRSYQSGTIKIEASSPGLRLAELTLKAEGGPAFVAGVTPLVADRPYTPPATAKPATENTDIALNRPTDASSAAAHHASRMADDGDQTTWWQPDEQDQQQAWWQIDFEGQCRLRSVHATFAGGQALSYLIQMPDGHGGWRTLLEHAAGSTANGGVDLLPPGTQTRLLRLTFPQGDAAPRLSEVQVIGSPVQ
jgi:hypothetical protein